MTSASHVDVNFRVVVAGSSAVGKSCFINRIANDSFDSKTSSTIGINYMSRQIVTDKNVMIRTCYTDLAGQERFRSVCQQTYRYATAVVLVFDASLAQPTNADEDAEYWIDEINTHAPANVPIILVANKIDICKASNLSNTQLGTHGVTPRVLDRIYSNCIYYASAKTGEGIEVIRQEIRRIEELTSAYQKAAAEFANLESNTNFEDISGDIAPRLSIPDSEALLCLVPTSDGKYEVVKGRGLVNLDRRQASTRGAVQEEASSSAPFSKFLPEKYDRGCSC